MARPRLNLAAILALCVSVPAGAQGTAADTAHARAVRAVADSLLGETCRGGTLTATSTGWRCAGATGAPRVTVLRYFAARLHSLEVTNLDRPRGLGGYRVVFGTSADNSVKTHYATASGAPWPNAPTDTVTVCATIHWPDGSYTVGYPPVAFQAVGDSGTIPWLRDGNVPITEKCGAALGRVGLDPTRPQTPVTWRLDWFIYGDRPIWRPSPAVRVP